MNQMNVTSKILGNVPVPGVDSGMKRVGACAVIAERHHQPKLKGIENC